MTHTQYTDGLITKTDSLWNYADKTPPTCCDVGARAYILLVRAFLYRRPVFLAGAIILPVLIASVFLPEFSAFCVAL